MFDPLKSARKLEDVGFTREQAEANVELMTEFMQSHLATKQDMAELKYATQTDFVGLRADFAEFKNGIEHQFAEFKKEIRHEFAEFKGDLSHDLKQLEYRMTIRLGTIVCLALAAFVAVSRLGLFGLTPH